MDSLTLKRIFVYVLLVVAGVYFGLRLYAQFRHVDVYVSRVAPMPAELASQLPMQENRIDRMVRIESPYDPAADKLLSPEEIRHLRAAIAWTRALPAFFDSLVILSPTNVVARQNTRYSIREYQLVKNGGRWLIAGVTYQQVQRQSPE